MLPNVNFSIEIFFFSILSSTVRTESVWDEMIESRDERWWHWSDGGQSSWSSSLIITDHQSDWHKHLVSPINQQPWELCQQWFFEGNIQWIFQLIWTKILWSGCYVVTCSEFLIIVRLILNNNCDHISSFINIEHSLWSF